MKPLFIGNWKMHFGPQAARELARALKSELDKSVFESCDVGVAPAPPLLSVVAEELDDSAIFVASQNVHWEPSGAHTGEVSCEMLKGFNVGYSLVGHSERRQFYGETDATVNQRARTALAEGIVPVICIGESEQEYRDEKSTAVAVSQLHAALSGISGVSANQLVLAYEPVWAIGTGLAATPEHAEKIHAVIREELVSLLGEVGENIRLLYGGSCKPDNIAELMARANVDGALVGGASLKSSLFADLVRQGQ